MASVVEGVELLHVAGCCYRHRTQPIVGTRSSQHTAAAAHNQDWQVQEELEMLTLEDEAVDDSLIEQNGDVYSTKLSVDSKVRLSLPNVQHYSKSVNCHCWLPAFQLCVVVSRVTCICSYCPSSLVVVATPRSR